MSMRGSDRQSARSGALKTARWSGYRRLARCAPAVLLATIVALGGVYAYTHRVVADEGKPCAYPRDARPGSAMPWETSVAVSTYSVANADGNLLTTIPIIGWGGVGPAISMAFYHSSAGVDAGMSDTEKSLGFTLPPGWSCSYSAHIDHNGLNATVVYDDGTRVLFYQQGGQYVPPAGIHDKLTTIGGGWKLTHKDQSFHQFDSSGALTRIEDATGHAVTIDKASSTWTVVTDAAGRTLKFSSEYVWGFGWRLSWIQDENAPGEDNYNPWRYWLIGYDVNSSLKSIIDARNPGYGIIKVSYDRNKRISRLTDATIPGQQENTYQYLYTSFGNQILRVTDPAPGLLTQEFLFTCYSGSSGYHRMTYTDRRDKDWVYEFDYNTETLESVKNPLLNEWTFQYDADRNMTLSRDPLANEWTYTYDGDGNMLTSVDPLLNDTVYTYNTDHNVTSIIDPMNNVTSLKYEDPNFATLLTSVEEPELFTGGGVATTTMTYYYNEAPQFDGMLKTVRDPNNVLTAFEYDQWGQLDYYREGEVPTARLPQMVLNWQTIQDSSGRVRKTVGPGGSPARCGVVGEAKHDGANNTTRAYCLWCVRDDSPALDPPVGFPDVPCTVPSFQAPYATMESGQKISYDGMGRMTNNPFSVGYNLQKDDRTISQSYNELGMLTQKKILTQEPVGAGVLTRTFNYAAVLDQGIYTRTGPDGMETVIELDFAGRVEWVKRRMPGQPPLPDVMTANYTYYDDGLVHTVTYLNDTRITYGYDDARRLEWATHHRDWSTSQTLELRLDYVYNANGEITEIEEYTPMTHDKTTFTHDTRGRLTNECRGSASFGDCAVYDLSYTYDDGGNRQVKIDATSDDKWVYEYDTDTNTTYTYDTANNRLMYYEHFDTSGASDVLLDKTWYQYNSSGNVRRIINSEEGSDLHTATRFDYAHNGTALAYVVGETWDAARSCGTYTITHAREFRYDSGRQRYLDRELDPAQMELWNYSVVAETWTDYDGDQPYGDFTLSGITATNARSFQPGMATVDPWTSSGSANTSFYHTNQVGSTRMMSDSGGASTGQATYTAFGERISGTNHRYGYAGAYGYQQHDEFPFMHVGARYYDPATGRFLQRDPIGIFGGSNVYGYVSYHPVSGVDPNGLFDDWGTFVPPGWKPGGILTPPKNLNPPPPVPPRPKAKPRVLTPQEEYRKIRRNERVWTGVYASFGVVFCFVCPPVGAGLAIGAIWRETIMENYSEL